MPTELKLPQLSESLQEGTISRWYRREGEYVAAFDPLLEVETDKVTTDISAPASGTILKIFVPEGATVKVGTPLVLIGSPDEATSAPPAASTSAPTEAPPVAPPIAAEPSLPPVSPVAAKVAAELGVDLQQVRGTAPGGRITRQDVLDYAQTHQSATSSPPRAPALDPPAHSIQQRSSRPPCRASPRSTTSICACCEEPDAAGASPATMYLQQLPIRHLRRSIPLRPPHRQRPLRPRTRTLPCNPRRAVSL